MKHAQRWGFLLLFAANSALAASGSNNVFWQNLKNNWWFHPVASLSVGGASAQVGNSQAIFVPGDITQYQFDSDNSSNGAVLWGGFLGTELPLPSCSLCSRWAPANVDVGIEYFQPLAFQGNGTLAQGIDSSETNFYRYNYKVKSQQLLAEGKFLWHFNDRFHPYALFGLGAAFNTAYNYNVDYNPFLTFTPQFASNTTTSFSYSIGLGVDVDVSKNLRFGVGYRFAGLGKAVLGPGVVDTIPTSDKLSQSNLYANEGIAQFTYILN